MDAEIAEKLRILAELDIAAALLWAPGISKEGCLAGLHKARYECVDLAPELRQESGEWLRARGHCRIHGRPLLPLGELPV